MWLASGKPVSEASVMASVYDGKSIGLTPGGLHEQLSTRKDQELIAYPSNLGFVKCAVNAGNNCFLIPHYAIGENQQVQERQYEAVTQALKGVGFGLPFFKGDWSGHPISPIFGKPTYVQPTLLPEEIDEIFTNELKYLIKQIYFAYKHIKTTF